jgi:hypothetical protein
MKNRNFEKRVGDANATHKSGGVGERPLWCAFRIQVGHRAWSEKCPWTEVAALLDHLVATGEHWLR